MRFSLYSVKGVGTFSVYEFCPKDNSTCHRPYSKMADTRNNLGSNHENEVW